MSEKIFLLIENEYRDEEVIYPYYRFKEAGLEYPSPDFIPSNIITRINEKGMVTEIWIIDQFSVPGNTIGEKKLQKGSLRRMTDLKRWGLK